jgi:flagellar biosynthesis/type III secretory pathway protein FliH
LPVLPIAVYLRVGLQGLGIDAYVEQFQDLEVVKFQYLYLGLPQLDALEYLEQNNPLGVALSALMRVPKERRPWLKAESLRRLVTSQENEHRRFLLAECVQAYLPLTSPAEQRQFQELLATEPYQELPEMAATWFDEGLEKGLQRGLEKGLQKGRREGQREGQKVGRQEGLRQALLLQLESRFGKLRPQVRAKVTELSERQLTHLVRKATTAESLVELGLAE